MRIVPLITAIVVALILYGVVLKRDEVMAFATGTAPAEQTEQGTEGDTPVETAEAETEKPATEAKVRVMAMKSTAQLVDTQIILRGETEAMREVDVMAETAGKVISEPLRKGAFVQEG